MEQEKTAVAYDYVSVTVAHKREGELIDCYERLGWEPTGRYAAFPADTTVSFRRDRNVRNKEQLDRLKVKLDDSMAAIYACEKGKTKSASAAAVTIGTAGALVFGGGMCLCLLQTAVKFMVLGCGLGIVGAAVCGLAYVAYRRIRTKKTAVMDARIDRKRDEIAGILDEAYKFARV